MKVAYAAFCTQHSLPDLRAWLVLEDEVTESTVRSAFHEKLASFCEFLSHLVWPEGINALAEASELTEKEREHAHLLYDKCMLIEKDCLLAEIVSTPAEDMVLIKQLCAEWPSIVHDLREIVIKTKGAYRGHRQGAGDLSYLG